MTGKVSQGKENVFVASEMAAQHSNLTKLAAVVHQTSGPTNRDEKQTLQLLHPPLFVSHRQVCCKPPQGVSGMQMNC